MEIPIKGQSLVTYHSDIGLQGIEDQLSAVKNRLHSYEDETIVDQAAEHASYQTENRQDSDNDNRSNSRKVGDVLGQWRILKSVGGGGMSNVYLAQDERMPDRVAAIKVFRNWRPDNLEVQILNQLRRLPALPTLYDPETNAKTPFIAMEWIDGVEICNFVEFATLSFHERLILFEAVLRELESIQQFVVHGDIKPAHIIVQLTSENEVVDPAIVSPETFKDSKGNLCLSRIRIRILDFGISVLNDELEYAKGATPDYASPEQIDGKKINKAADVYSASLVLQEILVGKIYRERSSVDLHKLLTEKYSLEKEQNSYNLVIDVINNGQEESLTRRLSSIKNLRDKLNSVIKSHAIHAKRKVRRGIVLGCTLLALLISFSIWILVENSNSNYIRRQLRSIAKSIGSVDGIRRIVGSVDVHESQLALISENLGELESSYGNRLKSNADWYRVNGLNFLARSQLALRKNNLIEAEQNIQDSRINFKKARTLLNENDQKEDLDLLEDLALSYSRMGDLKFSLQSYVAAQAEFLEYKNRALEIAKRTETFRARRDVSLSCEKLGSSFLKQGKTNLAASEFNLALKFRNKMTLPIDIDRRQIFLQEKSALLDRLGDLHLHYLTDLKKATSYFEDSIMLMERLFELPNSEKYSRSLSISYEKLGDLYLSKKETSKAIPYFKKSASITEQLSNNDPLDFVAQKDWAISSCKLGDILVQNNAFQDAIVFYEKSLEKRRSLRNLSDNFNEVDSMIAFCLVRLSNVYRKLNELEKSIRFINAAFELRNRVASLVPSDFESQQSLLNCMFKRALLLKSNAEKEQAIMAFESLIEQLTVFVGTFDINKIGKTRLAALLFCKTAGQFSLDSDKLELAQSASILGLKIIGERNAENMNALTAAELCLILAEACQSTDVSMSERAARRCEQWLEMTNVKHVARKNQIMLRLNELRASTK